MAATPRWFTVAAVVALLWNLLGCVAFASDLALTPDDIARLPAAQQALYAARAPWAVVATGGAVIGGAIGALALLLRRRWSIVLLGASLAGIVLQDIGLFVLADGVRLAGPVATALQGVVLAVGVGLVLLARHANARGWLR